MSINQTQSATILSAVGDHNVGGPVTNTQVANATESGSNWFGHDGDINQAQSATLLSAIGDHNYGGAVTNTQVATAVDHDLPYVLPYFDVM